MVVANSKIYTNSLRDERGHLSCRHVSSRSFEAEEALLEIERRRAEAADDVDRLPKPRRAIEGNAEELLMQLGLEHLKLARLDEGNVGGSHMTLI